MSTFTPPRQLWGIWNKPSITQGRWQEIVSTSSDLNSEIPSITSLLAVTSEQDAIRAAEIGRYNGGLNFSSTLTPYLIGVSPIDPKYLDEWLPIATAPRDGTLIMICWAGSGMPPIISRWLVNAEAWTTPFNKPTNPPSHWRFLPEVPLK